LAAKPEYHGFPGDDKWVLPVGEVTPAQKPRGRRGRSKAATKRKPKARRQRLSPDQTANLKRRVVTFLKANPGSTRKQIEKAVSFPSASAYTRVMKELKEEGMVVQKGKRGKAVYRVKGS
jgi:predicted HTH transcriptional regulator